MKPGAPNRLASGFTLPELMAVLLIMTLASMIVATGVPAAQKAYEAAVDASNSQILLATTTTRLRDVLSTADVTEDIQGTKDGLDDGSLVSFVSEETGYYTTIKNSPEGLQLVQQKRDVITNEVEGEKKESLVPRPAAKGAYTDLYVKIDQGITFDEDSGVFTIEGLKVYRSADNSLSREAPVEEVKVRALES